MPTYYVTTERFGVLQLLRDNIAAARRWAKEALGLGPRAVSRADRYRTCSECDCAPCVCDRHQAGAR